MSTAATSRIQKTPAYNRGCDAAKEVPGNEFWRTTAEHPQGPWPHAVQLAEAAGTTQRAISYYEAEAGFPPAPAIIDLARALQITTDELLGVKPPHIQAAGEDPEARRQWKRFQMVASLPERDQKAVIRLINSLVAAAPARRSGSQGERNAR